MNGIGITGLTVTNVMGYGVQKWKTEYYCGTPVEVTLLYKLQMDIVVSKVPGHGPQGAPYRTYRRRQVYIERRKCSVSGPDKKVMTFCSLNESSPMRGSVRQ